MTYIARALLHWRRHSAWLAFLESPAMAGVTAIDRTLIERYQHRYMNRHWSMMQRLAATQQHYAFAVRRFPTPLFKQLYLQREVGVGRLVLRDGSGLSLVLKAPTLRGREGELSLSLTDDWGLQISYATLSFVDDGRTVIIGCLQGAANNAGRDAIRELTRQSHGLPGKSYERWLASALRVARPCYATCLNKPEIRADAPRRRPESRPYKKIRRECVRRFADEPGARRDSASPDCKTRSALLRPAR